MSTKGSYDFEEPGHGCCHPKNKYYKFWILFFISLLSFGPYYAYDEISPLNQAIQEDLNISNSQFGLLFTAYSLPNIVLVFVGGLLGDYFGLRLGSFFLFHYCYDWCIYCWSKCSN